MRFNARYGHRATLCAYAGIPDAPVPVIIPHGVYARAGICGSEREVPHLPVLSYPAYRDRDYTDAGYRVIPSASPFTYALAMHPVADRPAGGTLFFLAHSTKGVGVRYDLDALRAAIETLPQPVTVCLHPHDEAMRSVFPDAVSCGTYTASDFLQRTIDLIGAHRFVATNASGTHAFYAIACGRPVRFVGEPPVSQTPAGKAVPPGAYSYDGALRALCDDWHEGVTTAQREFAAYHLRAEAMMSPERMREVLTGCA